MPKLRFRQTYGSPVDGVMIRAGAVAELPEFWAKRFIAEGIAELVETEPAPKTEPKPRKKK